MSDEYSICDQWYWWRTETDKDMQRVFCPVAQGTNTDTTTQDFPDGCMRKDPSVCFRPETRKDWWEMKPYGKKQVVERYSCGGPSYTRSMPNPYSSVFEQSSIPRLQKQDPPRVDYSCKECGGDLSAFSGASGRYVVPGSSPNAPMKGWAPTYEGYCGSCAAGGLSQNMRYKKY
jgi:hypothetical protein